MPVGAAAAIAGLVLQGVGLFSSISENESRNRRLRELGSLQADAERAAGQFAASNYLDEADRVRRLAQQTRVQGGEFVAEGLRTRSEQSLAFIRSGVRLSGSALRRLNQTTSRIRRGADRIATYAGDQDLVADRLEQSAESATEIADIRARQARLNARAGQRSTGAIALEGVAGIAGTVGHIATNWDAWFAGAPVTPAAASATPAAAAAATVAPPASSGGYLSWARNRGPVPQAAAAPSPPGAGAPIPPASSGGYIPWAQNRRPLQWG